MVAHCRDLAKLAWGTTCPRSPPHEREVVEEWTLLKPILVLSQVWPTEQVQPSRLSNEVSTAIGVRASLSGSRPSRLSFRGGLLLQPGVEGQQALGQSVEGSTSGARHLQWRPGRLSPGGPPRRGCTVMAAEIHYRRRRRTGDIAGWSCWAPCHQGSLLGRRRTALREHPCPSSLHPSIWASTAACLLPATT